LTVAWIALGVVLIAVELHHLAFYALFVALGAFAAAVVATAAPGAIAAQVAAAVVVAVVGIVLLRGRVSAAFAHHHEGERVPGVHGGLVGQEVVTLDVVGASDHIGHVRLAGERWRAISGADRPIPAGTPVLVTAVQGTTLIVWPVDGHLPPAVGEESEQT
jgi:membrane protein implicated in regulation of membrane protease activity